MTLTQKKAQEYILNTIDTSDYAVKAKTKEEKLKFLWDTFYTEYGWNINKIGMQNALVEWYQGLPNAFPLVFTNYDILELAKEWGTLEENAPETKEDRYINGYWKMLASNTIQLWNKYLTLGL